MIKIGDFDFDNILINKKLIQKYFVLWYYIQNLFSSKPLHIRFDEVDDIIRVYDGIRYLILFGSEKYDSIYNIIRHLRSQKMILQIFVKENWLLWFFTSRKNVEFA